MSEIFKNINNKKKKCKIGIAFGGGGSRGFAHLGVLKAFEEKRINKSILNEYIHIKIIIEEEIIINVTVRQLDLISLRYHFLYVL